MDHEKIVFEKLKGECKHYCPDWDYMAIDETCSEFDCCLCDKYKKYRDQNKEN